MNTDNLISQIYLNKKQTSKTISKMLRSNLDFLKSNLIRKMKNELLVIDW